MHALAQVTGGGLGENVPRVLPAASAVVLLPPASVPALRSRAPEAVRIGQVVPGDRTVQLVS